jgi:hypothetical protein
LISVEAGLIEPRMGLQLFNGVAVTAVVAEKLENQVLEVS